MFQSVAEVFAATAIGVLLSGANADGAAGLKKIREAGGYTLAQDPGSAEIPFMPQSAIDQDAVSEIVTAERLAIRINELLKQA